VTMPARSMMGPLVWVATLVLSLVGITAAVYRSAYLRDATTRVEPLRQRVLHTFARTDPRAAARPAELARFDARFAAHPLLTRAHVISGAIFLAFAPLQFWGQLRTRHRALHRWSGRVLICTVIVSAIPGLYFGLRVPFGGDSEALLVALVASFLLTALGRAYVAIRHGQVARHREWMLRAFAAALGIATTRVLGVVLDVAFAPLGMRAATGLVLDLWVGWALTIGAAELWIRYTRRNARLARPALTAA
jgi:uncharacterized membrane protein